MDRDMMQLADILVDWCEYDLERVGRAQSASANSVAREMVKCLAFTLANSQDAREVLARIVRSEMAEIRARFSEDER